MKREKDGEETVRRGIIVTSDIPSSFLLALAFHVSIRAAPKQKSKNYIKKKKKKKNEEKKCIAMWVVQKYPESHFLFLDTVSAVFKVPGSHGSRVFHFFLFFHGAARGRGRAGEGEG